MSDEKALLGAIWEHPHEDTPRLVYADWLEETGTPSNVARAEFIRAQCQLAVLPATDPRYDQLEAREAEILKQWKKAWLGKSARPSEVGLFARGFLVGQLPWWSVKRLVKLTASYLRPAPLWRYHYGMSGADLTTFLGWPQLHRVELFALRPPVPNGWVKRVAGCEGLRNVSELAFIECPMSAGDLGVILDAWTGRRLTDLWVNGCPIGDAGMKVIATHPATTGLRLLRAHSTQVTSRGVKAIVDSPQLDLLTDLTLSINRLGAAAGRHLLRWRLLPVLRELNLLDTGITEGVMKQIRALRDGLHTA